MRHEWDDHPYADVRENHALQRAFAANAALVGRRLAPPDHDHKVVGSTDMGNVSYLVPSIHPMLQVAPAGIPIHSPEFTQYAAGEEGDRAVIDGAKALALTVVDLWADAALLEAACAEFAAGPGSETPVQ
ncbi:MAG TPA: hypothetical protein VKD67_11085, partial [Acidimicrobiales bacterium]|nr:hypothetical protein [Acidimicrobiales bacterium]